MSLCPTVSPMLQREGLRLRVITSLAQGHTGGKWEGMGPWAWGWSLPRAVIFATRLHSLCSLIQELCR